jgi:acyl-CoA synthetase (AMP-forming)/AMP-acid ligase II
VQKRIYGVETEYGDEKIKAIIVPNEAMEAREILDYCRERLVDYKVPSVVEFRDELVKSSTGKVRRKAL